MRIPTIRRTARVEGPWDEVMRVRGWHAHRTASRSQPVSAPQQLGPNAGDAEQARPDVRPDHGPDLGHEQRLAPEDRPSRRRELLRAGGVLDVLDRELVAALVEALRQRLLQALDRAAGGAHALDRLDLLADREDRLDLQGRAEVRLRGPD